MLNVPVRVSPLSPQTLDDCIQSLCAICAIQMLSKIFIGVNP